MIYIILAMLFYTVATLLGTSASRNINPTLAAAIVAGLSTLPPLIAIATLVSKRTVKSDHFGIGIAVLDGIAIGLFTLTLLKAFSENKIGIVMPIVLGGSIFLATILSIFLFKEKVTVAEGIGLAFLAVGIVVITYARAVAK